MSMNNNALIPSQETYSPVSAQQIREQVNLIQQMMREVMKPDVHYGRIPGTDKDTLYKPGAEKICLTFRLAATFHVEHTDMPNAHREYAVRCTLTSPSGSVVGEGIGVCSTMESKYRYRWDNTGEVVPNEYWETRDPNLLGGTSYAPRKTRGTWMIFQRIDYDNPADYYNTCAKMAKKRAHVDATLTTTAASDIFEQDIEEMPEDMVAPGEGEHEGGKPSVTPPRSRSRSAGANAETGQIKMIRKMAEKNGVDESMICEAHDVNKLEDLPKAAVNGVLSWINQNRRTE